MRRSLGLTAVSQFVAVLAAGTLATSASAQEVPTIDATVATISNVRFPQGIALNGDGTLLYVSQAPSPTLRWIQGQGCQAGPAPANRETGSVAIFETRTWTKVADVSEPGTPIHAELNPADGRVYVAVSGIGVSVYQGTYRVMPPSPLGGAPHDVGIDPTVGRGLVTNSFDTTSNNADQTWVSLIELATGRVLNSANTGASGPHKAAVDPARHLAYVSHAGPPAVDVIDMQTGNLVRKISTGLMQAGAQNAIDLSRRRLYVGGETGDPNGKVVVIDLVTEQKVGEVTLPNPHSVHVDPATGWIWVPILEAGALHSSGGVVAVIDPDTLTERARVRAGHCPYYLDFDPIRRLAYVTNEADSSVTVIDTTKVPGLSTRLSAPAGLSYALDGSTISLTWRAVSGAASYVVEAGSEPGLANLAVWKTTALGLTVGGRPGTYYVRVRATAEAGGSSDPSDEVLIRAGTIATAPTTTDIQSPSPRVGAAMAYDSARGVLVLFGGTGGGSVLADTWERRGTIWEKRTPTVSPPERSGAAMAYDSVRGVTVLFGGLIAGGGTGDASFLADTWEWDGANWTERTPAISPGARYFAAVAYDATRRATVMFGGSDRGHTEFSETWEWDGTNWTKYPPTISPSARADAALAYDSVRGVSVLFSGDRGEFPDDTWERRGTEWLQRTPAASPPGRGGSLMAFDSARAVTVLFGGHNGPPGPPMGPSLTDTWEWDGSTWTQRTPPTSPPDRLAFAMAYDSARAVTVVFGGAGNAGPLGDTWEWDGSAWTQP